MLPRFEVVGRRRPVRLVVPGSPLPGAVAPYVAAELALTPGAPAELALSSGDVTLAATLDDRGVALHLTLSGRTTTHRSRRSGRPIGEVRALGLALTGPQLTAFTSEDDVWVARSRVDLTELHDVHDEAWLGGLKATGSGPAERLRSGRFGQLGLRDLRLVTEEDGTPCRDDDRLLLTATSAGPGWFPTGHASVWSLDPTTLELVHRADLFFRRSSRPGVYGDHAVHLVRRGAGWLVAASTWGDFDRRERPVAVTVSEASADLLTGAHVLDSRPLPLPTTGLRSVGVWDPHLVRADGQWLVGYVSASRYFRFHPVLATGASLDALTLRGAATGHRETEGTTLARLDGRWRVLASDKRRAAYPILDLDLREVGRLDAHYPTNIPWPTVAPHAGGHLLVGFNGRPYGGRLVGYGSHGEVVVQWSPAGGSVGDPQQRADGVASGVDA